MITVEMQFFKDIPFHRGFMVIKNRDKFCCKFCKVDTLLNVQIFIPSDQKWSVMLSSFNYSHGPTALSLSQNLLRINNFYIPTSSR